MRMWIIRHGQSVGNQTKIFGRDFELTDQGVSEARWLRDFLSARSIETIYSSPLARAMQTAEIIASGNHRKIVEVNALREVDYGDLEGRPYREAEQLCPAVLSEDASTLIAAGYPNGETHNQVWDRVNSWLTQIKAGAMRSRQDVVVVTHALVGRMLVAALLGLEYATFVRFKLHNGSASCVEIDNGACCLLEFNIRNTNTAV
jgi:alpha-ribazole phosphatase